MRKKLFLTYVVMIVLVAAALGLYSIEICRRYYTEEYKEHMTREVTMLSFILADQYEEAGEKSITEIAKYYSGRFDSRITVISEKGEVLYDSIAEQEELENHNDREEVLQAKKGEVGLSIRHSFTTGISYIYAATGVDIGEETLILRIAVPLVALTTMKNQVIVSILCCIIFVSIFAFLCAYFFAGKIVKPLNELTGAAEEITKGNYGMELLAVQNDQVGQLTKAFNLMSRQLSQTISQLETENTKLEAIVDSMINGVCAIDKENRILLINEVCYQMFHIEIRNIMGYYFFDMIKNESIACALSEAREQKKSVSVEFSYHTSLSGDKILRLNATPIAKQKQFGDPIGMLMVFQDVTQIRKLEQLRNDFVSNVTHELKTPLTSILGFTDTLIGGAVEDPDAARRFIEIIDIEAKRLYRLILDILSLSEIETRKEDVNVAPYQIQAILNSVHDLLQPSAEAKGLTLSFDIQKDLPLFPCNSDRITQMLINLIENAIKYTEKGGVSVSCRAEEGKLLLQVSDTGIGIPKESLNRIFERFYRVDKGRSRKAGGTGLGLSIVKHIVLLYDGDIFVESEEEKGSKFFILLPYR